MAPLKLLLQPILLISVIAAASIWPIRHFSDQPSLSIAIMATAAVTCLIAAIICTVPMCIAQKRKADWLPMACLAGSAATMLLTPTAALTVYYFAIDTQQMLMFALWITAFYLVMLAWQTTVAVKFVNKLFKKTDVSVKNV